MDLSSVVDLLNAAVVSKTGTAVAAVLLAVLVFALTKIPAVEAFVAKNPVLAKIATLVVAVVPAVVMTLAAKASFMDAAVTAVLTFLSAVGLGKLKDVVTTAVAKPADTTK